MSAFTFIKFVHCLYEPFWLALPGSFSTLIRPDVHVTPSRDIFLRAPALTALEILCSESGSSSKAEAVYVDLGEHMGSGFTVSIPGIHSKRKPCLTTCKT